MKRLIYGISFLAVVGIMTVGCQKEELHGFPKIDENSSGLTDKEVNQKEFKYNYEAKIKGQHEGTYAKYMVSSNDKDVAISMVHELKNSSLKLLNNKNSMKEFKKSDEIRKQINYQEASYDFEKGVHLVETERNIGNYKGYEIAMPKIIQRNGYLKSYSTITIQTTAGGIYVRNLWIYPNYNYHFYSDGTPGLNFDRMSTLNFYEDDTFTGGGYTSHYMIINPSYINGSFQHNNKIYWSVWP